VTVYGPDGRALKEFPRREAYLGRQGGFDGDYEFRGTPVMKTFSIGLWTGVGWSPCQKSTRPEFVFEFK